MSYESDQVVLDVPQNLSNIIQSPASYDKAILERNENRFTSQGVSYNNQARDIVIKMNSAGYCDPATTYLYLNLKTKHSGSQVIEDSILSLFGQCVLKVGGRVIERIEDVASLKPILYHTCTPEWLKTEGANAGMYRYITASGLNVGMINDGQGGTYSYSGDEVLGDAFSLTAYRRGALTNVDGLDTKGVKVPKGDSYSSNTVGENSSRVGHVGSTMLHNSMNVYGCNDATKAYMSGLPEGTNNIDGSAKTYCIALSLIFGLFRSPQYLPLRNMPIELNITLKSYNECFIHVPPVVTGKVGSKRMYMLTDQTDNTDTDFPNTGSDSFITNIVNDLTNSSFDDYTISNVHVQTDILTPAEALVSRIDALASGSTGIQMVLDSYNVIKQPVQRSTDITLHSTRAYSHLKDIYLTFKPQDLENNLFLGKSDTWYGSIIQSVSTTIGSKMIPASHPCNSTAEMFTSLRKSLGNGNKLNSSRGVVSLAAYKGEPESTFAGAFKESQYSGLCPSLQLARSAGTNKLMQSYLLPTQCHSNFMLGTNCQRVLGANSLSGINTLGQGYSITTNLKLKPFNDTSRETDLNSNGLNKSLDSCWGDAPIIATQIYHSDILLNISNGAVQVLE